MEPADSPDAPDFQLRERDDPSLVGLVAQGQAAALGELYDRYAAMLLALAQRVLSDAGEAEDVLQEAFLQVWRQARRYDGSRSSVSTWLVLITRSRAIDRLRSRRVGERALTAVQGEAPPAHTSPEELGNVFMQERRRRVRRELSGLPDEQRQVLEMAFYGGLTQRQIADRTGIPLGTVKTRTLLAMKKLRTALRDEVRELL